MERQLSSQAVDHISDRLAADPALRLPGNLTKSGEQPSAEKRQEYLKVLLLRDPGVFLERHGDQLGVEELAAFEPLRDGSYEVDFYMKLLEDKQDQHKQDTDRKNRRLAYMNRLLREGTFFSDDAMKERQPYLHHQYVGQYRPPGDAGPSAAGPGPSNAEMAAAAAANGEQAGGGGPVPTTWQGRALSQSLLRHQEELEAMLAVRAEQERYDRMEEESESEEEDEEEEEEGGRQQQRQGSAQQGGQGAGADTQNDDKGDDPDHVQIPDAERQENADAFLDIMKEKFLRGEEGGVDYRAIDADATLDDDWAEQAGRDAEEKYFDED
ncbi:hypothetical protein N2152v2_007205 [Parachlorella kessleri]